MLLSPEIHSRPATAIDDCARCGSFWPPSAELPPVSAFVAEDEGGHGLVGGPRLELVVGAVLLFALAARQQVCLGTLHVRQLRTIYSRFDEGLTLTLHLKEIGHIIETSRLIFKCVL